MKMTRLVIVGATVALCVGCSADIFRLRTEGPAHLPAEPQKTVEHEESVRALADWSARMWRLVHARGAEKAPPAVGQAAEAAEAVSADLGAPAVAVPLPPADSYALVLEVPPLLKRLAGERSRWVVRQWDYADDLRDYRAETVRKTWSFGIPVLAPWLGLGLSGLVIFWLVRLALKWRTLGWQVFLGVKNALAKQDPTAAELLKTCLSKEMDTAAKDLVKQLYVKVGE